MSEVRLPAPVKAVLLSKDGFHHLMFKGERFPGGELPVGAIAFNGGPPVGLLTCCPCGCGLVAILPFDKWSWDGNAEAPTLSPSILHYDRESKPHWHGFLQAGFWTQA